MRMVDISLASKDGHTQLVIAGNNITGGLSASQSPHDMRAQLRLPCLTVLAHHGSSSMLSPFPMHTGTHTSDVEDRSIYNPAWTRRKTFFTTYGPHQVKRTSYRSVPPSPPTFSHLPSPI